MKRLFLSWIVTPKRVRRIISKAIYWLIQRCIMKGAWDSVSALPQWLRKIADMIDGWNATELEKDKDRVIADLVDRMITDEDVDRIIDRISAMQVAVGLETK